MPVTLHPAPPQTWREKYTARGIQKSGLVNPAVLYEDFHKGASNLNWVQTVTASGTVTTPTTLYRGGCVKYSTGATANSSAGGGFAPSFSGSAWILKATTEPWYVAGRFAVTTTPDSATRAMLGLLNIANTRVIEIGVNGSRSTTLFCISTGIAAGSEFTNSTVAIDTAFHTYELWGRGTTAIGFSIDDGPESTHTATTAGNDASFVWIHADNGATAADQTIIVDEVLSLAGTS